MTPALLARVVDTALEASVVGSFSRAGSVVRGRLEHWRPPSDLTGRVVIVTGASSGIGRAAALELARLGATVWLVGRDKRRTEAAARAACAFGTGGDVEPAVLDIVDADAVDAFAARVATRHERLHGLVHAAGALFPTYRSAPDGGELTVATAVLAPFRLTWLLSPLLRRSGDANIVTLSSGGMYTQPFDLARLEMPRGSTGAPRPTHGPSGRRSCCPTSGPVAGAGTVSPATQRTPAGWTRRGWPAGCPRSPSWVRCCGRRAQGADTVVWLAAGEARRPDLSDPLVEGFFHDRRRRSEHHLPWTVRGAGATEGVRLWEWCQSRTDLRGEPPDPSTTPDKE